MKSALMPSALLGVSAKLALADKPSYPGAPYESGWSWPANAASANLDPLGPELAAQGPTANSTYDYIIVGASPGGAVLARRLTEDAGTNVLLIEAGPKWVPSTAAQR